MVGFPFLFHWYFSTSYLSYRDRLSRPSCRHCQWHYWGTSLLSRDQHWSNVTLFHFSSGDRERDTAVQIIKYHCGDISSFLWRLMIVDTIFQWTHWQQWHSGQTGGTWFFTPSQRTWRHRDWAQQYGGVKTSKLIDRLGHLWLISFESQKNIIALFKFS